MTFSSHPWPELHYERLQETLAAVQLWTQIVGKIRLVQMPWINHSWHVTLYVSPRGLTTGSIPYADGLFELEFDFIDHRLAIRTSQGASEAMDLRPCTVASFYAELCERMARLHLPVDIYACPNEVDPAVPFAQDDQPRPYAPEQMQAFWQALVRMQPVFTRFRARFAGKCSPVHFFWGGFDLAVTRFSGREAPKHPGGAPNMPLDVMQEAYSHEVSSAGFWAGSPAFPQPAFYSYCYPTPPTFGEQPVAPEAAFFSQEMGEFLLPYDAVRLADDPEEALLQFLQSTYEAAARTGNWDRAALEFSFEQ
ncbi:hypothetical protein SAMN05421823_102141 [Catalinimonas alkaloidigena]|uniref:Ava_C0101 and related proteins n=1 Tax=Catalinimonas alkaloidigena TaxID=1075417 RepID=A0A1G8ZZY3_9BACT|nr:DUF5996 family protein [Catalinimonas alkaloidigena]SDK20668.1 hypothetical protein SAMN05421823_102141 [Catalinimonas alkaloidigena]